MTDTPIVVICSDCVDTRTGQARRWPQNCELCAQNLVQQHRDTTGHTDIELRVTQSFTANDVRARIGARKAFFQSRKYGW